MVCTILQASWKILMTITETEDKAYLELRDEDMKINCRIDFNLKGNPWAEALGVAHRRNCITSFGESILFSEKEARGGIAYLFGATSTGSTRDSLLIMPFTCQKF